MSPETSPESAAPVEVPAVRPISWLVFLGLLAALGSFIYHPVRHFEFLNFDDNNYLSENPWLKTGLSWGGVRWAFIANLTEFSKRAEYWSPITLLSRLLDAQLFGVNAGPFHVTSALLHLLNAALLCLALWRLTGHWGRSAVVALLFLVHPLNVEPVCWLSARKDLLSATFLFATLLAYAHYLRRENGPRYLLLLAAYAASLMAKPMGMSTPFLLLLLDWWPLRRWEAAAGRRAESLRLLAEKIPLLILAAVASLLAFMSQQDWGALQTGSIYPASIRVENALVSYAVYLRRIVWPNDLALFYPHPGLSLPIWEALAAGAFLVAVTAAAFCLRRRTPYFLAGWLWFGLALGPVIGLVQIGAQAMADRYAYPSIIGIFIALVWGGAEALRAKPRTACGLAAAALAAFAVCSSRQVLFFRNSETIFRRALAVTRDNDLAQLNLGCALLDRGDFQGARDHYLETIRLNPRRFEAWNDLAFVENKLGRETVAAQDYAKALQLDPENRSSLLFLGRILAKHGRNQEAEELFLRLRELEPQRLQPCLELGDLYGAQGRWKDAALVWSAYLESHPGDDTGQKRLAAATSRQQAAK